MGAIVSQITSLKIVYSTVYSGADKKKQQRSASLAYVRGIQRGPHMASNAENISIWWRHHAEHIRDTVWWNIATPAINNKQD